MFDTTTPITHVLLLIVAVLSVGFALVVSPVQRIGWRGLLVAPAVAQAAMLVAVAAWASPATQITLTDAGFQLLSQALLAILSVVLSVVSAWVVAILQKRNIVTITADARTAMNNAAMNAAGRILASQESSFVGRSVDVHSELIAREVPKVMEYMAGQVHYLGWTPERVADLILAKLGILQTQAMSATTALPKSAPAASRGAPRSEDS